jgi:hypothetical protein
MTPDEADQRIIFSRRTLAGYLAVGTTGKVIDAMRMISDEVGILEGIAVEHPIKAPKLERLILEWAAYRRQLRSALH